MKEIESTESAFFIEKDGAMNAITSNVVNRDAFEKVKGKVDKIYDKVFEVKNPTQYIFINSFLKMNAGKVAAQVAHAQEELFVDIMENAPEEQKTFHLKCMKQNPRTVIILSAKDSDELYSIEAYLRSCDLRAEFYIDEENVDWEKNKHYFQPTAVAVQYVDKEDPRIKRIFQQFDLYKADDPLLQELKDAYWWHKCDTFVGGLKREIGQIYKDHAGKEIDEH